MKYLLKIRFSDLVAHWVAGNYLFVTPAGKGYWAETPKSLSDVAVAWAGNLVYDATQGTPPSVVEQVFDVPPAVKIEKGEF